MDAALGWLGDIVRALLRLVPQLVVVRSTHEGVRFRNGKTVSVLAPGLHIYWPLVTEVDVVPVKYQTTNLQPQYLETADGHRVGVSGIVAYEIEDVRAALCDCYDLDDVIADKSLAAIKQVVTANPYDYFKGDTSDESDDLLTEHLADVLEEFGVNVLNVQLTDFTESKMIALWGLTSDGGVE